MKNTSKYLLISGGIILGLVGGITIGVSEANDIQQVARLPHEFMVKVAGGDSSKPIIPVNEIVSQYENDGSRVVEIELDREFMSDVYELEIIDTSGKSWDIDVDARTGKELSKYQDWDD